MEGRLIFLLPHWCPFALLEKFMVDLDNTLMSRLEALGLPHVKTAIGVFA